MHIKSALGLLCSIDAGGYNFGQTECLANKQQNRLRQQGVLPACWAIHSKGPQTHGPSRCATSRGSRCLFGSIVGWWSRSSRSRSSTRVRGSPAWGRQVLPVVALPQTTSSEAGGCHAGTIMNPSCIHCCLLMLWLEAFVLLCRLGSASDGDRVSLCLMCTCSSSKLLHLLMSFFSDIHHEC